MRSKLSQSGVEYLILIGFLSASVIVILGLSLYYTSVMKDTIKMTQLDNFANKIISTSESVFYAGEPSKATINAYLPVGVNSVSITDNELVFVIQTSTGVNIRAYSSNVPVSLDSGFTSNSGVKRLEISANQTTVTISQI